MSDVILQYVVCVERNVTMWQTVKRVWSSLDGINQMKWKSMIKEGVLMVETFCCYDPQNTPNHQKREG